MMTNLQCVTISNSRTLPMNKTILYKLKFTDIQRKMCRRSAKLSCFGSLEFLKQSFKKLAGLVYFYTVTAVIQNTVGACTIRTVSFLIMRSRSVVHVKITIKDFAWPLLKGAPILMKLDCLRRQRVNTLDHRAIANMRFI